MTTQQTEYGKINGISVFWSAIDFCSAKLSQSTADIWLVAGKKSIPSLKVDAFVCNKLTQKVRLSAK
ncbi:MAG: hypothetical protein RR063_07180 [Anaerovoracaceae bacterium]